MNPPAGMEARLLWALDRQARQMATSSDSVQFRVGEALIEVLLNEGHLEFLFSKYFDVVNGYTENYFGVPASVLTDVVIVQQLSVADDDLAKDIFNGLYLLQKAVSEKREVLA